MRKVQELITNTHLIPTILGSKQSKYPFDFYIFLFIDLNNQQMLFGKTAENKEEAKDKKNQTSQDQPANQEEVPDLLITGLFNF